MSYQVLARKWRPRNFKEMAGQGHVLKTLISALDNNRLHHAYLFTGTRGVGKTTIARILARCLNCEKGITSEPCGECSACVEISEGRFLDLIEVDAASRTKVEDTRELLENVQYAPSRGRFKVYLIDEVHMLSTHSFNALLKTLEEPPPHVKFLLATTDPQKLPVTVLSRCLQFNLKNISPERLVEHIRFILEQEKIEFEEGALWQLGRAAQGSVRDCLTLLDQAIGFCDGKITDAGVSEFLGNIDRSIIVRLVDALIAQDPAKMLGLVAEVAEHSPDFAVILRELLSWLHRLAIAQVVPDAIDNSQGDRKQVQQHAASLNAETLQLYYQIALKGKEDMPYALDPRSGLEMTLLRMFAFTPAKISQQPGTVTSAIESQGTAAAEQKKKSVVEPEVTSRPYTQERITDSTTNAPQERSPARTPAPISADQASDAPTRVATASANASSVTNLASSRVLAEAQPAPERKPIQDAPSFVSATPIADRTSVERTVADNGAQGEAAPIDGVDFAVPEQNRIVLADLKPSMWMMLFPHLVLAGVSRNIAANCILKDVTGNHLLLLLQETQATLFSDEHRRRIETAMSDYFAVPIVLRIETGVLTGESPSGFKNRKEHEYRQRAEKLFTEDPVVRELVERFNGDIQYESITPLAPRDW
ncbi:MAG: DNA polymerase III subunit gamma/tau [Pseudomonadota bacterium]